MSIFLQTKDFNKNLRVKTPQIINMIYKYKLDEPFIRQKRREEDL